MYLQSSAQLTRNERDERIVIRALSGDGQIDFESSEFSRSCDSRWRCSQQHIVSRSIGFACQ